MFKLNLFHLTVINLLLVPYNTNFSQNQIIIQPFSPALSNFQPKTVDRHDKALDFPKPASYQLPTYTLFPPVKLPSFKEWKQQSSGNKIPKDPEAQGNGREEWQFPPLHPPSQVVTPQIPKISIPEAKPTGTIFVDKEGRFNYADSSCGAKVLKTNANCISKNEILRKNKDSYLANECSQGEKFIEVELCDTIWVTSAILGNLEYFSSTFKEIKISASRSYPPQTDEGWFSLGTFTAQNLKQLQRFNTLPGEGGKRKFVKYLRFDLLSHYGNEFYCPVTQVIVHGITMLEDHLGKGGSHAIMDDEKENAKVQESSEESLPNASENIEPNSSNLPDEGISKPPPSPTQTEPTIPPKPVELPKEPPTSRTQTDQNSNPNLATESVNHPTTTSSLASFITDSKSNDRPIPFASSEKPTKPTASSTQTHSIVPTNKPSPPQSQLATSPNLDNLGDICLPMLAPILQPMTDLPKPTPQDPFSDPPKPLTTLTPLTSTAQAPTQPTPADDDGDDHDENVFKSITQRLTKLEREFALLQDYLQVQTQEFNTALVEFQSDQREQLMRSYLFLNATLNRELYALRRLQGDGWSRLMEVIDVVGDRSRTELASIREDLHIMQSVVKWLVLGELMVIVGLVVGYLATKWLRADVKVADRPKLKQI